MRVAVSAQQLREIQLTEFEILKEARRVCDKHHIPYVIIAGTLLGAVRHRGFIPWDDDADIALLRKDYETFRRVCETELDDERFVFQDDRNTPGYRWGYGRLCRKDTVFLREHQEHLPFFQGIHIDVFPLDEVPRSHIGRCIWNIRGFFVRKLLWAKVGKVHSCSRVKRAMYTALDVIPDRLCFSLLHRLIRRSQRLAEKNRGRKRRFVRILMFPTPNRTYGYLRTWYAHRSLYTFEGEEFHGIRDAHGYLSFKFGDYMKFPKLEERKSHPVSKLVLPSDWKGSVFGRLPASFSVFGTGYVAGVLYKALQNYRLEDRIKNYIVSNHEEGAVFKGRPVMTPAEYARSAYGREPVLIAAHESALEGIQMLLSKEQLDAQWIYPYLPDLLYGKPISDPVSLSLGEIISRQDPQEYWLAVRYGAVRAYYEHDPAGEVIYRRAFAQFASGGSADKRLAFLHELIESVEKNGFDPDRPVLLDEKGRLIDGLHRVALARYKGVEKLACRIYPVSPDYESIITERTRFHERIALQSDLTQEEWALLQENQRLVLGRTDDHTDHTGL